MDPNQNKEVVIHQLSPEVADKYELAGGMHPTRAILGKPWKTEVDFRTMTIADVEKLMDTRDDSGNPIPFPFLKLKSKE
jgi:hypothetical protein